MHVAVVGAGIVGVSTAIWLQREGHQVTLIDRVGPAAGTSHGNAGVLAAGSVVPIPVPGADSEDPQAAFGPESTAVRALVVPSPVACLPPALSRKRSPRSGRTDFRCPGLNC